MGCNHAMKGAFVVSGLLLCNMCCYCDCAKKAANVLCGLPLCKVGCYYAMCAVIVQSGLLLCYVVCDCAKWAAIMLCGL